MHVNTNNKIKPQFLFALKKLFKSPPPHLKKMTWVVYRGIYNSRVIVLAMTSGGKETKKYVVESYLLGSLLKIKACNSSPCWNTLYYRYFVL